MEAKKPKLVETKSRMVVSRVWGWRKQGGVVERVCSGELMYSMMIMVNNIALNTWKLLVDLKFSHTQKKEMVVM